MKNCFIFLLFNYFLFGSCHVFSQSLDVSSCPTIEKRNNGNGRASSAAGNFPGHGQNNPVATNVTGTPYQNVYYDPTIKTGNINFIWPSVTPVANLPVITRAWLTASGSSNAVLSQIYFGPPPPPVVVGQNYYVNYSFYVQNIPPTGKITLEFSNPQTNQASFYCTYDLQNNGSTTTPTFDCTPDITTQPSNANVCGTANASFTVASPSGSSFQWQVSSNGTSGWANVSNGGNYSGVTSTTLTISSPSTYDGKYYRAVVTGNGSCGTTNSTAALLVAKPKPTAAFTTSSYCGTGSRSVAVNLTGTGPWSITYTATPSVGSPSTMTVSNISSSTYYFSVNPSIATTYTITAVSDANCTNSAPTGNVTTAVNVTPTITPSNASTCYGSTSFNLSYTATGSPDKYTLTAGTRTMPGFSTISNASLTSSPATITIPSGVAEGVYDFNLVVTNNTTGCYSVSVPLTVTVNAAPALNATAGSGTVCSGTSATLTASPSNLTSYAWTISPSATVLATGVSATLQVNSTTTYTVTGTNANGCTSTANVTVTATTGPSLTVTPSAPTICSGSATTLSVSGGSTYSWSPSTGLTATTGSIVVASPSSTTTYTITSANAGGCQSVATVTVTVSIPSVSVTPSASICSGTIKTLTASGASTYAWYPATGLYTNAGATTPYSGTNLATVYAKPNSTTTYYVNGTTAAGCEGVATSTVSISPAPVNTDTSTGNNLVFCTQGTSSFPLNVKMTADVDSAVWSYSTNGSAYTSFRNAVTVSSTTLTPASNGSNPTKKYICTLSGYGNSAYGGPRYFRLAIYTTTCSYNYDIYVTDTKGTNPTPPVAAGQTTICGGNSILMNVGSLASGTTAQWQQSSDSSSWSNIAGATANITVTPASTTYYRVQYNGGNGNCGSYSGAIKITVVTSLGANTLSPATTCTDGTTAVNFTGSDITGGIFQWQKSTTTSTSGFSNILGATSQNYSLPANIVPTITWYRRIASTGICATDTSTAVVVYPPISNNQITNGVTSYCASATATALTGSTPAGGSGSYVYQWKNSTNGSAYSNISGATSINYTTPVTAQTTYYQRVITSGGCTNTSLGFVVTVNANPTVTVTPGSTVCSGTSTTLTASGATTYSWSPSTELSGTTGPSVIASATVTRSYTVTGTNSNGCTAAVSSTLTVSALPSTPTLSASSQTICSGNSISLTSKVTSGGSTVWYTAPVANASYQVATPASVSTSGTYYAFAQSGSCYSSSYASFTLSVSNVIAPSPASTSVRYCSPATADLTALQPSPASGTSLEWHTASSSPTAGNIVATPASAGTGTYYLYAYSSSGSCYGAASSAVSVTLDALVNGSVSATSAAACTPSTVNLNTYNNTAGSNTYNWYTSSTLSPSALVQFPSQISQAGTYYLFATTAAGCTGAASAGVTVSFNTPPTTSISSPDVLCGTTSRTINGTSNAASPTWQWQISTNGGSSWSNVTNISPYSGVTTSALAINPASGLGGNYYRYTVTDANTCAATSNPAILTEDVTPVITTHPVDRVTYSGNTTTFTVTETSPTADYQWQVSSNNGSSYASLADSGIYSGSNSPTLRVTNLTVSQDNYLYRAVISNSCTNVSSTAARLNVSGALPVTWVDFSAHREEQKIVLNWSTASEENAEDFLVQHSMDGINWTTIGTVMASGNSNRLVRYSFDDAHPGIGVNYYQLWQRDRGGRTEKSKLVSAEMTSQVSKFSVYPNPVVNGIINVVMSEPAKVELYSSAGILVFSKELDMDVQQLDVSFLSKGYYFLKAGTAVVPVAIQ